jgi:hypothetical protein
MNYRPEGKTEMIGLRLTPGQLRLIETLARYEQRTPQDVIRGLINRVRDDLPADVLRDAQPRART